MHAVNSTAGAMQERPPQRPVTPRRSGALRRSAAAPVATSANVSTGTAGPASGYRNAGTGVSASVDLTAAAGRADSGLSMHERAMRAAQTKFAADETKAADYVNAFGAKRELPRTPNRAGGQR
jgi:hypothetical protein